MKLEKTCKCFNSIVLDNKGINSQNKPKCKFISGREYQVDVFTCFKSPDYFKVYLNGGTEDWAFLDKEEFAEGFIEIE